MNKIALLGAVLGIASATSAYGQAPSDMNVGDRLKTTAGTASDAAAVRAAHSMAKCVATKRPAASQRILAAVDPAGLKSAHRSIWASELGCYSDFEDGDDRRFAVSSDVQRGLIAEQLLLRSDSRTRALAPLPLRPGSYQRSWFAGTGRSAVADEMGTCLAETDPAGIHAVLVTSPTTAEEQSAFNVLTPAMGKCLSAGAKLMGTRQAIRAALADALYQRAFPSSELVARAVEPRN